MGEGNPNRQGKGQSPSRTKRRMLEAGMFDIGPVRKDIMPGKTEIEEVIPLEKEIPPEIPKAQTIVDNTDKNPGNRASIYRTGPTIETVLREPIKIEKGESDLSTEETKKLAEHIHSVIHLFDFVDCLKKDDYKPAEKDGRQIRSLVNGEIKEATDHLISYLIKEFGKESIKKAISANEFPELEYFEEELHKLAKCYYHIILEKIGAPNKRQEEDLKRLDKEDSKSDNLEKYPAPVLGAVHEVLSKASGPKEEKKETEDFVKRVLFQEARYVRKMIGRILALISDIDAGKKRINLKDTKPEIADRILQARLYNPNIPEHIKRFDELSRLEGVDIEAIRQEILSGPKVVVLKDSPGPEGRKNYGYVIREKAEHEAREIFRNDPEIGEYAKALLDLNYAIGTKNVKIEGVEQKEEKAETRIGSEGEGLIEKIKSAVDERLKFLLEKINSLTEEQKKALGIDEAELQGGVENLKSVELEKIYKWCQDKFGGPLKDEIADPKKFEDWINYYVDSAFTVHGNEAMKKAYERAFVRGRMPIQETVDDRLVQFNKDEERFLNLYLKKYQEEIVSFFELVKSDEEIEKFKRDLLNNIEKTREWAIKMGFEEKKADVLKERLERDVMDFFREREAREEFIPTSKQMNYTRRMTDFLNEFSEGILKIVEEKGQQDSWTEEDSKRQLRTAAGEVCQKYFIGKEGYAKLFKGDDLKKLVDVAVEKYSKRKLREVNK